MARLVAGLLLGMAFVSIGCEGPGFSLSVDLRTDLQPGVEFDELDVSLFEGAASADLMRAPRSVVERSISRDIDTLGGARVAEFMGLGPGSYFLVLRVKRRGLEVGRRLLLTQIVESARSVTILLTRDCAGVVCPQDGDNPSHLACLGGTCVDPGCSPQTPERCPLPECTVAAACASSGPPCLTSVCLSGVCGESAAPGACAPDQVCDPTLGCVLDQSASDAGPMSLADAGTDSGIVPPAPRLRWPANGHYCGSVHAPDVGGELPLRPALIWSPAPGATSYELEMDNSCPDTPLGCLFPSPEVDGPIATGLAASGDGLRAIVQVPLAVSTAVPVGARYAWRVRACSASANCGAWSEVRYLNVGRAINDLDGDGFSDLVVSARSQDGANTEEGAVYLFYGFAGGVELTRTDQLTHPVSQAMANFGVQGSAGADLNGDGFFDLVVGAWNQSAPELNEGAAYVYYGRPRGPSPTPDLIIDSPRGEANAFFGSYIASVGDVDGDGYDDILIGAPNENGAAVDEGRAYLFLGSATGLNGAADLTFLNPLAQANANFGLALGGLGDVNGDGFADFAISAPNQDNPEVDEGTVYVYFGGLGGPGTDHDLSWDNPADQSRGVFGYTAVGAGDLNGDGYADSVVGASGQSSPTFQEGNAFVYYGSANGPATLPELILDNPNDGPQGFLGDAGAGGCDHNGDGFADLMLGAPNQSGPEVSEGAAFYYEGGPNGLGTLPRLSYDNPVDQSGGFFGATLGRAGDVNGDGYCDWIVGAPLNSNPEANEGAAYLFYGGPSPVNTPSLSLDNPLNDAGGNFGSWVAGGG